MRHALLAGLAAGAAITAVPATALAATPWVGTQAVSAAGNGAVTVVPTVPQPPHPAFAVNDAGQAVVAWPAEDGTVLVARRAPAGTWTAPQSLGATGFGWSLNGGLDIAIDAAGDATVAWVEYPGGSDSTKVYAATSTAGGAFASPVTIASGTNARVIDIAMNASGQAVAAWDGTYSGEAVYASSANTVGGWWSAPVKLSDPSVDNQNKPTHEGLFPRVAINAGGTAVATWVDHVVGTSTYHVYGTQRAANGAWAANSQASIGNATSSATAVPVLDDQGRETVLFRNGTGIYNSYRWDSQVLFHADASPVASNCSGTYDTPLSFAASSDGSRTVAFICNGHVQTITRDPFPLLTADNIAHNTVPVPSDAQTFAGATATELGGTTSSGTVRLDLSIASNGQTALMAEDSPVAVIYTRGSMSKPFSAAQLPVEPDTSFLGHGIGVDTSGDAVALLGTARVNSGNAGVDDLTSSVLDVTAPVASIDGPTTAYVGDLVTFKSAITDAFGGFTAPTAWTSTDGSSGGSGPTFERTFVAAGTYKITATQTDIGGHTATATLMLTVTAKPDPTPTPTPTPVVTPAPGNGQGGSTVVNNTTNTTNNGSTGILMPPTSQPTITGATLSPSSFKVLVGKKGGSALTITLSAGAVVEGVVSLQSAGVSKSVAGATTCAAPPKKGKAKGKSCIRLVPKGTLHFGTLAAGPNKLALNGKVGNKKLAPGKYSLGLQLSGASAQKTLTFTIKT